MRCLPHAAVAVAFTAVLATAASTGVSSDVLPSWSDGAARQAIVAFVTRVATTGSTDFVPPAERIAVFDNDGTLWAEQPMYVQAFFIIDRINALASRHPEWRQEEPFAS